MNVTFFEVDGVLNFEGSEAKAPDGSAGIAEARVKALKKQTEKEDSKLVLFGSWCKDWDFDTSKCTPKGTYLNKKLERRGLHILDKTKNENPDSIKEWLSRHSNVTSFTVLKSGDMPG